MSADGVQEDLIELEEKDTSKANFKDRNYYLKNIPLDKEKLARSHSKKIEAYYDLGLVYREQFEDNEQAKKAFEKLVTTYDTSRLVLPGYYHLYKIYQEERNKEKEEYYKNKILKDYPESEYARIIQNPDYFADIFKEKSEAETFYKETYGLFQNQQYASVISNATISDSLYPKNYLAPKFHFLKTLAVGKMSPVSESGMKDFTAFEAALKEVIQKYPKEDVAAEAQKILDLLTRKQPLSQALDSVISIYKFKADAKHSCVLVFPMNEDVNKIKIAVSDFNNKYFSLAKLNTSDVVLDEKQQMVTVKYFEDMAAAMNYYHTFKNDTEFLAEINAKEYPLFVISYENFAIFYNQKKVDEYLSFFAKTYPVN